MALQNRLGIPSELLAPDDVGGDRARSSTSTASSVEAFARKDGFIEDSDGLTQLLAERAKDEGARVRLEPALAIERKGSRVTGVTTPSGLIEAASVILAAGCDSAGSRESPSDSSSPSPSSGAECCTPSESKGGSSSRWSPRWTSGWAGKQLIDGVIYMGYLREAKERKDDWAYTEQVAGLFLSMMPSFSDMGIKRLVDGYYDTSPDGHPFLGPVSGLDGYFQAAGFSGHGYMLSPAVGKVMAEMVLGNGAVAPGRAVRVRSFRVRGGPGRFGDLSERGRHRLRRHR